MKAAQTVRQFPRHEPHAFSDNVIVQTLNRWYDRRMFLSWGPSTHDFANYGYWQPDTRTYKEACENLMERLLASIPEKTGSILDVACGKGATTKYLLKYYSPSDVVGINISPKQLHRASQNAPGCEFLLMNAAQLKFPANSFENVICVEAAHHFDTREKFLCETFRVLKPGGRIVLSDMLLTCPSGAMIPRANFISNLVDYHELYRKIGFDSTEIADATYECWIQFFRRAFGACSRLRRQNRITEKAFRAQTRHLLRTRDRIRYYVIAAARKPMMGAP